MGVDRRSAGCELLPDPLEAEGDEVVGEAAALVPPPAELERVGEESSGGAVEREIELPVAPAAALAAERHRGVRDRIGSRNVASRAPDRRW